MTDPARRRARDLLAEAERQEAAEGEKRGQLMLWLALAGGLAALGIVLLVFSNSVPLNVLAYVVGSLVPLFLVTLSRRSAVRWQEDSGLSLPRWVSSTSLVITVVAVVGAVLHAYLISRHVGPPV